ncbi:DsbA family protein [Thermoleophilum album]|uniref:DsbA family protein n=1 Tax=Thermoleophilum album TaxID=29539 RepID=UPI0015A678EF|nr:thioredoxin domain-containing protein [Thermoleophilum album]
MNSSRKTRFVAVVAAAAVLAGVAIAASLLGSERSSPSGSGVTGAREVRSLLQGILQSGYALGDPRAPATVVEFVDLQCPFCARLASEALPDLIRREVRSGRLRLELRVLAFIGPDSERAARFAAGAARQYKVWQFTELFFRNQGRENSGYVTDNFLRRIGAAIPGFDVDRALAFAQRPEAEDDLERARLAAGRLRVSSTPTLFLVPRGGQPRKLELSDLTASALREAIRAAAVR